MLHSKCYHTSLLSRRHSRAPEEVPSAAPPHTPEAFAARGTPRPTVHRSLVEGILAPYAAALGILAPFAGGRDSPAAFAGPKCNRVVPGSPKAGAADLGTGLGRALAACPRSLRGVPWGGGSIPKVGRWGSHLTGPRPFAAAVAVVQLEGPSVLSEAEK